VTAPLRLGTRRSNLATSQSRLVAQALTAATGRDVELVEVTTLGDTSRAHLSEIGGTGVFAAALRQAVADGEVDLAVHSLKDLPTAPVAGLVLAAVPVREDPRDVLVARDGLTLQALPQAARVGTGSPSESSSKTPCAEHATTKTPCAAGSTSSSTSPSRAMSAVRLSKASPRGPKSEMSSPRIRSTSCRDGRLLIVSNRGSVRRWDGCTSPSGTRAGTDPPGASRG